MIKPKFEDFDYGDGRKDLSLFQYAKALEEYVTFLESERLRIEAEQTPS